MSIILGVEVSVTGPVSVMVWNPLESEERSLQRATTASPPEAKASSACAKVRVPSSLGAATSL